MTNLPSKVVVDFKKRLEELKFQTGICNELMVIIGLKNVKVEFNRQFDLHRATKEIDEDLKCRTLNEYLRFIISSSNDTYEGVMDFIVKKTSKEVCSLEAVKAEKAREKAAEIEARDQSKTDITDDSEGSASLQESRAPRATALESLVTLATSKWFVILVSLTVVTILYLTGEISVADLQGILSSAFRGS